MDVLENFKDLFFDVWSKGISGVNISEIIIDPKKLNINADKFENLIGNDSKFNADKIINIFKVHIRTEV